MISILIDLANIITGSALLAMAAGDWKVGFGIACLMLARWGEGK